MEASATRDRTILEKFQLCWNVNVRHSGTERRDWCLQPRLVLARGNGITSITNGNRVLRGRYRDIYLHICTYVRMYARSLQTSILIFRVLFFILWLKLHSKYLQWEISFFLAISVSLFFGLPAKTHIQRETNTYGEYGCVNNWLIQTRASISRKECSFSFLFSFYFVFQRCMPKNHQGVPKCLSVEKILSSIIFVCHVSSDFFHTFSQGISRYVEAQFARAEKENINIRRYSPRRFKVWPVRIGDVNLPRVSSSF